MTTSSRLATIVGTSTLALILANGLETAQAQTTHKKPKAAPAAAPAPAAPVVPAPPKQTPEQIAFFQGVKYADDNYVVPATPLEVVVQPAPAQPAQPPGTFSLPPLGKHKATPTEESAAVISKVADYLDTFIIAAQDLKEKSKFTTDKTPYANGVDLVSAYDFALAAKKAMDDLTAVSGTEAFLRAHGNEELANKIKAVPTASNPDYSKESRTNKEVVTKLLDNTITQATDLKDAFHASISHYEAEALKRAAADNSKPKNWKDKLAAARDKVAPAAYSAADQAYTPQQANAADHMQKVLTKNTDLFRTMIDAGAKGPAKPADTSTNPADPYAPKPHAELYRQLPQPWQVKGALILTPGNAS